MEVAVQSVVALPSDLARHVTTNGDTSKHMEETTIVPQNRPQNNHDEDFHRWRPNCHLMAKHGWINDPCGPGYDPAGRCYHVSFQWNPYGSEWGNISWGHSTSKDLVHWTVSSSPSIQPSPEEDPGGVFTGCTWPTNPKGKADGTLTSLYTSAQRLPIHWTLPYQKGSEIVRMATSKDHGKTWKRDAAAPFVLPGPPEGMDVTGWRDPFISTWPSLSQCLGHGADHLYGVVAGGIRNVTPAAFLYSVNPRDLSQWTFMCTLFTPGINFKPSARYPDFGANFEVTNFFTIRDEYGESYDILFMGVEGSQPMEEHLRFRSQRQQSRNKSVQGSDHVQNWLCGGLERDQEDTCSQGDSQGDSRAVDSLSMRFRFGGCMDHGCFYAANSFHDPLTNSQIVFGWIQEDLPPHLVERQKWCGLISLPRRLHMQITKMVVSASSSDLRAIDWLHCEANHEQGTFNVTTLGITPDPRLSILRQNEIVMSSSAAKSNGNGVSHPSYAALGYCQMTASRLEVQASMSVPSTVERIGIILYHSPDKTSRTTMFFQPVDESFVVERHAVYREGKDESHGINDDPLVAPHTLLTTVKEKQETSGDDAEEQEKQQETLDIHLFYDVSVLEIFVNERVAITTRVYPESGKCCGVELFATYKDDIEEKLETAEVTNCGCWELQPSVTYES